MLHLTLDRCAYSSPLLALLTLGLVGQAQAAPTAFQDPATASWGGWIRGSTGSLFTGWDVFNSAIVDTTPDLGSFNTSTALLTENSGGAFVTGGGNIYSFSSIVDIDVVLLPTSLAAGRYTVALQLSVLGGDVSDSSILLGGLAYTRKTVLATGSSSAPPVGGSSTGIDNEYLYIWEDVDFPIANFPVTLEFNALGTSMSLDAVMVDVGPAPAIIDPEPEPEPTPVPIPGAGVLLSFGLAGLGARRGSAFNA